METKCIIYTYMYYGEIQKADLFYNGRRCVLFAYSSSGHSQTRSNVPIKNGASKLEEFNLIVAPRQRGEFQLHFTRVRKKRKEN